MRLDIRKNIWSHVINMHWFFRFAFTAMAMLGGVTSQYTATTPFAVARSSNYGKTDQFRSDWSTGTCRCWGPDSYRPNIPCFDKVNTPSHITAVDTSGMSFSQTCGTCLLVTCINGVTRGLPWSEYPYPGCKPGNNSVVVTISDSCPCLQNASNNKWCCQDKSRGVRHLDLSTPAFTQIAEEEAGVVDILVQQIDCPDDSVTGVSWSSWEQKYGQSIQDWSKSRSNVNEIASVEGACNAAVEGATYTAQLADDAAKVLNRTGELPIGPKYAAQNGLNATNIGKT